MAWEARRGANYYYQKVWSNGTCQSKYIGGGAAGQQAAVLDRTQQQRRTLARSNLAELRASNKSVDQAIGNYRRQVRGVVASTLEAAGYHQHHRSEWRLKRGHTMANKIELAAMPTGIGLLAQLVLAKVLNCAGAATAPNVREALLAEMAGMRTRMGWADAPQHERLLIEATVLAWLHLQFVEQTYAQNSTADNYVVATVEHFERRLSFCHRRYLDAVTALARVRRLSVNLQVNIAHNQVVANC